MTFADINETVGKQTLQQLSQEFGANKIRFVKADVCDREQFEGLFALQQKHGLIQFYLLGVFKETVNAFKNVDILINNAGILNDSIWEKQVAINIVTTTRHTSCETNHNFNFLFRMEQSMGLYWVWNTTSQNTKPQKKV